MGVQRDEWFPAVPPPRSDAVGDCLPELPCIPPNLLRALRHPRSKHGRRLCPRQRTGLGTIHVLCLIQRREPCAARAVDVYDTLAHQVVERKGEFHLFVAGVLVRATVRDFQLIPVRAEEGAQAGVALMT